MARALTSKVTMQVDASLGNLVGLANVSAPISRAIQAALQSGTGANQADWAYSETNSLIASGTKDYDLSGTLTDVFGATILFARIKLIAIWADAGNTNNVVLGAAGATQFVGPFGAATHTAMVRPGGCLLFFAPDVTAWPVVGGASDLLRVTNSAAGTPVLYDILFLGASV